MKPNTVIVGWPNSWRKKEENGTQVFVNTIRYRYYLRGRVRGEGEGGVSSFSNQTEHKERRCSALGTCTCRGGYTGT